MTIACSHFACRTCTSPSWYHAMAFPGFTSSSPSILIERALQFPRRRFVEVEANQHLRRGQVRRRALGGQRKRDSERTPCLLQPRRLQVGKAEEVVKLHVVRSPLTRGLEVRQRLLETSCSVERQAKYLLRLAPLDRSRRELRCDRQQLLDRLLMLVGMVRRKPAQVCDEGIACLELAEPHPRLRDLPGMNELSDRDDRCRIRHACLRGQQRRAARDQRGAKAD
jgi:hypothetical protein